MKQLPLFLFLYIPICSTAYSQDAFISTWRTTEENQEISIPTHPGYSYLYDIDWEGDGTWDIIGARNSETHVYPNSGTHKIHIRGKFPAIYFNNGSEKDKILSIDKWGNIAWKTMANAFRGCKNLTYTATDTPDLSSVTNMSQIFYGATSFNGNISNWNVSSVTNMYAMFAGATSFNKDLQWDVSSVTDMRFMFAGAASFNGDICGWNVSSVTNMSNMFVGTTLSVNNYDALLTNWSLLDLKRNVKFNAGNSKYASADAITARQQIIENYGWSITDGGQYIESTDLAINEVMYNSNSEAEDEWIEIYNASATEINLSGWVIEYGTNSSYTFPSSSSISHDSYITIALGSNGDGTFNNDNPFTPDFNNLEGNPSNQDVKNTTDTNNLSNSGGTIVLKSSFGTTVDGVTYGTDIASTNGAGPSYEVQNNSESNTNTNQNWQASAFNGGSPGKVNTTTWLGDFSSFDPSWTNESNWSAGVPTPFSDVKILSNRLLYPIVSSEITVNSVLIESGAALVTQADFNGEVTYNRTLNYVNGNSKGWHLVSSPVSDVLFNDTFVSNNDIAVSGSNRGVAKYNESDDNWSYLQSQEAINSTSGIGYSVKRRSFTGTVSFTGNIVNSDVNVVLDKSGNGYNLLGNPFTAYVNSSEFLNDNASSLASKTLWLWNQSTENYETKISSDNFTIAPGQGFFVKAASDAASISFDKAYETDSYDTFQKTESPKEEVVLKLTDGRSYRFAKIYYTQGATTSFDNGYDGETFDGQNNNLDIYSHLVTKNVGKNYQIQSLPNKNHSEMIIPIGVIADANKELTFSVETLNLPEYLHVYLEDKTTNSFTLLNNSDNYKITTSEKINNTGRFYLHVTSDVLSNDSVSKEYYALYSVGKNLRITGIQSGNASVAIYSVHGQKVQYNEFQGKNLIEIPVNVSEGIYIVTLTTAQGTLSKKLIFNK